MQYYAVEARLWHLVFWAGIVAWSWLRDGGSLGYSALFAAIFFNNLAIEVGVTLRLDYVLCASLALAAVPRVAGRRFPPEVWVLGLLLSALLVSSTVAAASPSFSVRKLGIVAIYVVASAMVVAPAAAQTSTMDLLRRFLRVANRVLLVSLVGYLVQVGVGLDLGLIKETDAAWLRGPMINANLFGSTAAAVGVLCLAVALFADPAPRRTYLLWWGVAAACVFLSYTRAAWLVFGLASAAVWIWSAFSRRALGVPHLVALGGAVVLGLGIGQLAAMLNFEQKLGSVFAVSSGTGLDRVVVAQAGLRDWLESPVLGKGFEAWEYAHGTDQDPTAFVQMVLFVQLLEYGGAVTFGLFGLFLVMLHWRGFKVMRRSGGAWSGDVVVPLLLVLDAMIVAYQATSGLQLAFFWFLAMFAVYVIEERMAAPPDAARA